MININNMEETVKYGYILDRYLFRVPQKKKMNILHLLKILI